MTKNMTLVNSNS